jgi:hypothetical protein
MIERLHWAVERIAENIHMRRKYPSLVVCFSDSSSPATGPIGGRRNIVSLTQEVISNIVKY